jgi:hypothetical protein
MPQSSFGGEFLNGDLFELAAAYLYHIVQIGLRVGGSKYFDWKKRYGRVNEHNGAIPRDHWLDESERKAILEFHAKHPLVPSRLFIGKSARKCRRSISKRLSSEAEKSTPMQDLESSQITVLNSSPETSKSSYASQLRPSPDWGRERSLPLPLRVSDMFSWHQIVSDSAKAIRPILIAIGNNSKVMAQAADVVVLDNKLTKVDEFLHIGRRMKSIALQCALGGLALSVVAMILSAFGYWISVVATCQYSFGFAARSPTRGLGR